MRVTNNETDAGEQQTMLLWLVNFPRDYWCCTFLMTFRLTSLMQLSMYWVQIAFWKFQSIVACELYPVPIRTVSFYFHQFSAFCFNKKYITTMRHVYLSFSHAIFLSKSNGLSNCIVLLDGLLFRASCQVHDILSDSELKLYKKQGNDFPS